MCNKEIKTTNDSTPLVLPLPSMKLTEKKFLVWKHFIHATLTSNRANKRRFTERKVCGTF
ncbi:hypothetical protein Lal_00042547 [Lupinus albus]|nr:hypothetical protein Lal_00042547 [Lupinus albus]